MDLAHFLAFLAIVALASYIQALSGFALGLIVLGTATLLDLAPIAFTGAVISLLSLLNGVWVLRKHYRDIQWPMLRALGLGLVPGVALGLGLLHYLEQASPATLQHLLGGLMLGAGLVLTLNPEPWALPSPTRWRLMAGFSGGVLGGLFSTAGPPVVFFLYRQPLAVVVIRATLLALFLANTLSRLLFLGLSGQLSAAMLKVGLIAFPAVILGAQFGARKTAHLPPLVVRRLAFGLLMLLGILLLLRPA